MSTATRRNQALNRRDRADCHDYCGCSVAGCCFQCPLAVCKFDDIDAFQAEEYRLRQLRLSARASTLRSQGHHPRSIAIHMGTTERTVYRYLAQGVTPSSGRYSDQL